MYSKKKHNINFTKPAEPAFITRLKQQAGYVEGPSVETKKEQLEFGTDEDYEDKDDEKPTVVVMKDGDLTKEEAELHERVQKHIEAEKVEKADLSQRVIFKRKKDASDANSTPESTNDKEVKKKKKDKEKCNKIVLSFNDGDEDE